MFCENYVHLFLLNKTQTFSLSLSLRYIGCLKSFSGYENSYIKLIPNMLSSTTHDKYLLSFTIKK